MCDGPFGSALKSEHYTEAGVRVIRLQNIGQDRFLGEDVAFVEYDYFKSLGGHDARPGDLLVAALGDEGHPVGRACVLPDDIELAMVKADCFRVRLDRTRLREQFVAKFLSSPVGQAELGSQAKGSTRERITLGTLASTRVPIPPLLEQQGIVSFLDKEVARLDRLVAAKERLLELLVEKRRALITRAVTRGLNPSTPLRDSGISWLGDIPLHWKVVALRFLVSAISGATPDTGTAEYWDGQIPWVSPKDMKKDLIEDSQEHVSDIALSASALRLIEPGAVLIVVRGMILAHSFPTAINTRAITINQDMKALRCVPALNPYFLRAYLDGYEEHIVSLTDSSAHGTRKLETETIGRLDILVPPLAEQLQIVEHLEEESSRLDAVNSATECTIALLKERRAALIATAVTGQIDVEAAS
jgi:type I restriction enzyme S subunit